jgi:HSP20 family protein
MLTLWNGFDRSLGRELRALDTLMAGLLPPRTPALRHSGFPPVNVVENEQAFELSAEVPGFGPEDISVSLHEGVLRIEGKLAEEREGEEKQEPKVLFRERQRLSFVRTFELGDRVAADKIGAQLKDGVLTVRMPKREEVKPLVVKVKSA